LIEPDACTLAGPDLLMDRSADAVTVVLTDEVLLPDVGSLVVLVTLAVLAMLPACAGAVTVTVMTGAVAPAAKAGRVQVTEMLALFVQVHPAPLAETNVTPAGSVSVTETLAASDGPLFVAVSW
jgi:hypothetical protein